MADYNGGSFFWGMIDKLLDGQLLTHVGLYKNGLYRLQDGLLAVRDMVLGLRSDLGQTETVRPAVVRSPSSLGSLLYYDPVTTPLGSLDGKTLILISDIAGPVTVTFAQPTTPAAACAQINSQASALGIIADVDDGIDPVTGAINSLNVGRLRIRRYGSGTPSITVDKDGTANGALSFSTSIDTTVTGTAATALDGASRIGVSAYDGWPGGTLRTLLTLLITDLDGLTPTILDYETTDTDQTITPTETTIIFAVSTPAANRTYTIAAPPSNGLFMYIRRPSANGNTVIISGISTSDAGSGTINVVGSTKSVTLVSKGGAWRIYGVSAS